MVPMRIKSLQAGKVAWQATLLFVEFRDKYEESMFAKP
jgi:hypothetical protein